MENDERRSIEESISRSEAILALKKHTGWVILEEHFTTLIKILTEAVCNEEDVTKVPRLQERLRAFKAMLSTVDLLASSRDYLADTLKEFDIEQNEIKKYGLN